MDWYLQQWGFFDDDRDKPASESLEKLNFMVREFVAKGWERIRTI